MQCVVCVRVCARARACGGARELAPVVACDPHVAFVNAAALLREADVALEQENLRVTDSVTRHRAWRVTRWTIWGTWPAVPQTCALCTAAAENGRK